MVSRLAIASVALATLVGCAKKSADAAKDSEASLLIAAYDPARSVLVGNLSFMVRVFVPAQRGHSPSRRRLRDA